MIVYIIIEGFTFNQYDITEVFNNKQSAVDYIMGKYPDYQNTEEDYYCDPRQKKDPIRYDHFFEIITREVVHKN